jgi:ribosomal-protein-alanine N-acetyltransferase
LPLDEAVDAVAGDAGLVADDGAAGAGEAIEEGGLADVGAAADGDHYYRDVALPAMERGEEWTWTLRLREAPHQIIGAISLGCREDNNRGFWIGLPWQGQGLMSEAVFAANDFWFEVLGFSKLRVPKAVANISSSRISAKTGMRLVSLEKHEFVSGRLQAEIWEMTVEEWREHKRLYRP